MDYNLLYLYTSVVSMAFNIYSNMSIQRKFAIFVLKRAYERIKTRHNGSIESEFSLF